MTPVPLEPAAVDALVSTLDANGDGEISLDEWSDFLQQRAQDLPVPALDQRGRRDGEQ